MCSERIGSHCNWMGYTATATARRGGRPFLEEINAVIITITAVRLDPNLNVPSHHSTDSTFDHFTPRYLLHNPLRTMRNTHCAISHRAPCAIDPTKAG